MGRVVDSSTNHHGVLGAGARFYLTPRLGVGPEVVYMRGPDNDRDFMLSENPTLNLFPDYSDAERRV